MSYAAPRNRYGWAHIDAPVFVVDFNRMGKHGGHVIDALHPTGIVPRKSRHCRYCGKVGPRTQIAGGWAHKRCLPKRSAKAYLAKQEGE